ncbi:hypothetical protein ElyMa_002976300 [Elysia marginata]|uniref:Uncharacterized protein n=1 Tax=Elysia marginata TaxID=1093978 RepID=A0AAV4I9M8_9GAST|nr:hypothetical protein ElyMa_002976300 [Elysia marginata]
MARQDFVDIDPVRAQLVFRNTAVDGSKVRIQKATRIKICLQHPGRYFVAYTHNDDDLWQEVNIAKPGPLKAVKLKPLYSARREIPPATLKDLKSDFIPVEHRNFYRKLQAATSSPRRLRTGAVVSPTSAMSSEDEMDSNFEMPSAESDSESD